MQRTYYVKYSALDGIKYDKIVHRSPEDRPRWHKVEALDVWKSNHAGHSKLTIKNVLTASEYRKENRTHE